MFQHLGDVVNLANGKYSFLCYAADDGYKNFSPHLMTSWSQGPLSIGTKYKHKNKGDLCSTIGGRQTFSRTYTIVGPGPPHRSTEDRVVNFVIQNWEFKDGRMTYLGDQKVDDNYMPDEDDRWKGLKDKFTKYYRETIHTKLGMDMGYMAAAHHFSSFKKCEGPDDISNFLDEMSGWLQDNYKEGANYSQYEDDTKEGVWIPKKEPFNPKYPVNAELMMEWYFNTMAGASERAMDIRCLGRKCKKLAFPDDTMWPDKPDPKCNNITYGS